MKDRNFDKSLEVKKRIHQLIPGGCHTYAKGDDQFPEFHPPYLTRGEGCRVWDLDLAELAHNEDQTLLAFSTLATGLLTGKYQGNVTPPGSRRTRNETLGGRIAPRAFEAVDAYLKIARDAGLDPAAMAIAWTMTRPVRTVPIIGATNEAQLAVALSAADLKLSPEVLATIEAAHRAHPMPY